HGKQCGKQPPKTKRPPMLAALTILISIRPRGFEPLTYGFVGDLNGCVRKCTHRYEAVLTRVSGDLGATRVLLVHARTDGEWAQNWAQRKIERGIGCGLRRGLFRIGAAWHGGGRVCMPSPFIRAYAPGLSVQGEKVMMLQGGQVCRPMSG